MTLTPGTRLGPYEIVAAVGAGGMGQVYRARDTRLGRVVAVKVLHLASATAAQLRSRIEREARAAASLNHPGICTIHDIGRQDELDYLVMEFLDGLSLQAAVRKGPLPPAVVLDYAGQIGRALSAAHARGIVHRDLKPSNLIVTADGTVKILDFGIAKLTDPERAPDLAATEEGTAAGMFVGTASYASPEQVRGTAVDQRADIFSLGALLYELLTGLTPFARETKIDTMLAILRDDPPPLPSNVPPALAAAISRCLAKNPVDRFQTVTAFLQAIENNTTSTTPAITVPPPAAPPSIAVLPFADLSPERDQEYFCDGMADELIAALMTLQGVRVASRTSSFQFKGRPFDDVTEIGRKLKVSTVLEGSVRKAGSRLRVTVQLTDVTDGFQIWSERYDRAIDDVFAVQDEIARAVVEKLKVQVATDRATAIVGAPTRNIEAYNLYLQGRYSIQQLTKDGLERGMHYFAQALRSQPDFAEAQAAEAYGHVIQAIFSVSAPRDAMPKARAGATRALQLNPNLAAGHLALAMSLHWYAWDWTGAEQAYRRALQLAPGDPWVRMNYAVFLAIRGRFDEAFAEATRAIELDPVSLVISRALGDTLYLARRYEEALEWATRAIRFEPRFFSTYWVAGLAHIGLGQTGQAVAVLQQGRAHAYGDATIEGFLGWALALDGQRDAALEIVRALEARRATGYLTPTHMGLIYQGLGDMDTAIGWFRQACDDRATDCCSYLYAPHFDVARRDVRFRELLSRIEAGSTEVGS